jgi:membrane fusion protein, multidrug efflux system
LHRRFGKQIHGAILGLALLPGLALGEEQAAAPVVVATAVEEDILQVVQLSGTVTALRNAQLSVSTSGLVTALQVDAGDRVEQGQLLLEMDAELARQQYASARAARTQAERALADARRRLQEARKLAPQRSIAETAVRDLEAEVAEDEAALEQVSADAGYREGILQRHQLKAPFSGVISSRSIELGEWVTPGQAVLGLVSTDQLRLDFQVPEDHLADIKAGSSVDFSLGADRDRQYPGTVLTAVPVTDPTVRTFLLRVEADEAVPGMLPGMSASASIKLHSGERGVTIPRDALLRYSDGRVIVWVIEEKDGQYTASERRVQPGFSNVGQVAIAEGLATGEQVVVKGNESLRSGQRVSIRSAEKR